jgi:hypothetical protein
MALAACSSGSDSGPSGSWGGSSGSNGNGNGASGPTSPTGGNAGSGSSSGGGPTVNEDASTPASDAGTHGSKDGGADAVVDAAPVEDTGSPANTFSLVNTNVTGVVYGETIAGYDPILNNAAIDIAKVGKALSIRANTKPLIVDHIDFVLDGTYTHSERSAPYFLCGDNGQGTITNCIQYFTNGAHMLTINVYALGTADAGPDGGPPLDSSTLYFTVTDGATDAGGGG